jgi:hypothetical protein
MRITNLLITADLDYYNIKLSLHELCHFSNNQMVKAVSQKKLWRQYPSIIKIYCNNVPSGLILDF